MIPLLMTGLIISITLELLCLYFIYHIIFYQFSFHYFNFLITGLILLSSYHYHSLSKCHCVQISSLINRLHTRWEEKLLRQLVMACL